MNIIALDDAALLRLVAQGQSPALGVLYDRYARLVFSLALHIVGDHPTAEDVTQDVFTTIWEKASTYRVEQSKVTTWLTSITRNRSIDILRRRSTRPEKYSVPWAEVDPEYVAAHESAAELAERSLLQQQVRAAISSLPDDQRSALALAFFRGYSHTEIAGLLGEPLGTVKTRIRLGMQKLRQILIDERTGSA